MIDVVFFFYCSGDHRDLHVRTHSCPTRRSSDLHACLEHPGVGRACAGRRRVICSGEALPASLVESVGRKLPGVELHNLYGPTEAAVDVTAWNCSTAAAGASVPIGDRKSTRLNSSH